MYKLNTLNNGVIRTSDNAFIPMDEQNSDYIAYLKFIEDGGQAIPSDSVPLPAEETL
jgi:hypothetical protein